MPSSALAAPAAVLWVVMTVLPGLALLRLLRVTGSVAGLAALSAPLGYGLLYTTGLLATLAGMSVQAGCFAVLAVLGVVWSATEALRRHRRTGTRAPRRVRRRDPELLGGRLLLVAAVLGGLTMWVLLHQPLFVPAGWDAMHHGYFVRQIVDYHTLDPRVVLSSDPTGRDGTTGFYPLAADLVAALINSATGIPISAVLLGSTVAMAGVVLPAGIYAIVRRVAPGLPLAAGLAAVAAELPARLYTVEYTGRITVVIGIALVPAVVGLVLVFGRRLDRRLLVVLPLSVIALFGVHSSELVIAAGIVLALVLVAAVRERAWLPTLAWLGYAVAAAAVAAVVMYAADPHVVQLVGERTGFFANGTKQYLSLGAALRQALIVPAPFPQHNALPMAVWSTAALAGCVATLHARLRRMLGFSLAYLAYALFLTLWSSGHIGPFAQLGDIWYQNTQRVLWEYSVLGAVPFGCALFAIGALVHAGALRLPARRAAGTVGRASIPELAAAGLLIGVVVALAFPPVHTDALWLRRYASPVDRDDERAYAYLAAHVTPHVRVLDDLENRGELWMYADEGVPTLFGNPPLIGAAPTSWKDRLYLRAQLRNIGTDTCVRTLIRAFDVRYVYYSTHPMWAGRPEIALRGLESPRYFRQVFRSGSVRVFAIQPMAARLSCRSDIAERYPWATVRDAR